MFKKITAGLITIALSIGLLVAPNSAQASKAGRRNTFLGLGAAALYELSRGHGTSGLILGAGAYYAYTKIKDRHGREHWKRHRVYSDGPPYGHAYGYHRQVPRDSYRGHRGHAYGFHRHHHNWDNRNW